MRKLGISLVLISQLGATSFAHAGFFKWKAGKNEKKAGKNEKKTVSVAANRSYDEMVKRDADQKEAARLSSLPKHQQLSESLDAQRDGKEYPTASWMWGGEGPPKLFRGTNKTRLRIVYLHANGARSDQSRADGPHAEKFVAGLRSSGVDHEVVSLPWEGDVGQLAKYLHSSPGHVVVVADGESAARYAKSLATTAYGTVASVVQIDSSSASFRTEKLEHEGLPMLVSIGAAPSLIGLQLKNFIHEHFDASGVPLLRRAAKLVGSGTNGGVTREVRVQTVEEEKKPADVVAKPVYKEPEIDYAAKPANGDRLSMIVEGHVSTLTSHDKIKLWLPTTSTASTTHLVEPEQKVVVPEKGPIGPTTRSHEAAKGGSEDEFKRILGSFGQPWDGAVAHFPAKNPHPMRILYFHGGGAKTNDGIIERIAGAMGDEGINHEIFSLPYDGARSQVEALIASSPGKVILAGHSLGGGFVVNQLMRRFPDKVQTSFLINPVDANLSDLPVPTLVIRGSEDGGKHARDDQFRNVKLIVPHGGDHSLRFRMGQVGDKEAANKSDETKAMNRDVAKQIGAFLAAHAGK